MICVFHCFQPVQVPFWEKLHIFPAWSSNREGQKSSMIHMSGMHRRKPSQCLLAFISCILLQHFLLFTRIAAEFWHISNLSVCLGRYLECRGQRGIHPKDAFWLESLKNLFLLLHFLACKIKAGSLDCRNTLPNHVIFLSRHSFGSSVHAYLRAGKLLKW